MPAYPLAGLPEDEPPTGGVLPWVETAGRTSGVLPRGRSAGDVPHVRSAPPYGPSLRRANPLGGGGHWGDGHTPGPGGTDNRSAREGAAYEHPGARVRKLCHVKRTRCSEGGASPP
ncbi:hypothetical protein GCM10010274_45830 [Streptomyces lavendofoliae]|uniref:Uncharacterized protein n=1 Tax=Streptomyces lavendofoliae TaxID=67314 RepID=A0A918M6L3_9ACTN|nr:hypothetical protein GCM10010274_45830 [Streptomyces lavendofoliae]